MPATPRTGAVATERVHRLLQPAYSADLPARPLDALLAMHEECAEIELGLSYYRRLAQARVEILRAERERRERGGTVGELVADLPRILSEESGRSSVATTRGAPGLPEPPKVELRWPDGREQLVADATLARLPALAPEELTAMIAALEEFEHEVSGLRTQVHAVIDAIDRVIADRRVAGTAG